MLPSSPSSLCESLRQTDTTQWHRFCDGSPWPNLFSVNPQTDGLWLVSHVFCPLSTSPTSLLWHLSSPKRRMSLLTGRRDTKGGKKINVWIGRSATKKSDSWDKWVVRFNELLRVVWKGYILNSYTGGGATKYSRKQLQRPPKEKQKGSRGDTINELVTPTWRNERFWPHRCLCQGHFESYKV